VFYFAELLAALSGC